MSLPVQKTPFIGRVCELRDATELLRAHRLLTLVGAGGSGKTRLALQLAAQVGERFPDGTFWVSLAPLRDTALVEQAIAQSVSAQGGLTQHLADRCVLVVLDNMEQVAGAGSLVTSLLASCPTLHLLVTSREPLRITAEQRFAVHPLTPADAVTLFVERARAIDPTFVEEAAVEAICRRVDCLPLAVELAATRMTVLTPDNLLARLERRLPLLTGGQGDMPERHQTLRDTIAWSEDLLSDPERQLFRDLAIFPASFDLEAAQAVCAADLATMSSLIDKCLVGRANGGRFALLETVHEFANERLTESQRDELARRHGEYFVAAAEVIAGNQRWPSDPETFGRIDEDMASLRAALAWTRSQGRNELTLRLGIALSRYWIDRGCHHDACEWLETAPLADVAVPASLRAAALEAAGMLDYFVVGESEQAERYYVQSMALHRELGDRQRVAFLLNRLGRIARERGDINQAVALHRDALHLFEAMADNAGRAASLHLLGEIERDEGRFEEAEQLLADAIRLARASYPALVRHSLHSLGDLALDRGDCNAAVTRYEQSLELTGTHERRSRILCGAGIASALAGLATYSLGARLWGAVEAEERTLGSRILSDERQRYERWANTMREGLGEAAFLTACAEGERLRLDEVLRNAMAHAATEPTRPSRAAIPSADGCFQREGEYWTILYQGRVVRLRDSKGVRVLAHLLADPGRPHAAVDLERLGAPGSHEVARAVASSDSGEFLDGEARRAYRSRVAELREALEAAEASGKADEGGLLREEMDFIAHELSRALGLGGRSRRAGSIAERARLNVMRAVRSAMQRICRGDAELGAHLDATVHTGTVCVYTPDPRVPISWRVTSGDVGRG